MLMIAKRVLIVGLLTLWTGVCSAFAPAGYPTSRSQFEPLVANTEVRFSLLDRRPQEATRFRQLDRAEPKYAYGDDQFFPPRLRVVATHFADAFPRDAEAVQLVIKQLDVIDYVPRPFGDGRVDPGPGAWLSAAMVLTNRALNPNWNSVTCRFSGSYAGNAFTVSEEIHYDQPASLEHRQAVTGALLAAITKAINEVRTERQTSAGGAVRAYASPSLEWYYVLPRQSTRR